MSDPLYKPYTLGHSFSRGFFAVDGLGDVVWSGNPRYPAVCQEIREHAWKVFTERADSYNLEQSREEIRKLHLEVDEMEALISNEFEKRGRDRTHTICNGWVARIDLCQKQIRYLSGEGE